MNTNLKVLLAVGGVLAVPGLVSAQTPPPPPEPTRVLYACYQQSAGVVYRIREPGLPDECRSHTHIMFSWNETGPTGPAGPAGEAGAAGERGLTGLACWDANGNGVADPAEDANGDQMWDARDCQGPAGPPVSIPPGSITVLELANGAVTGQKVASGAITSAHVAAGAIGTQAIADRSIRAADIGFEQVTSFELAGEAVQSRNIAPDAVRMGQIAPDAVSSRQIHDYSIAGVDLAIGSVGPLAIANNAVGGNHVVPNAINSSHVADGSLRAADLLSGTITLNTSYQWFSFTIAPGQWTGVQASCSSGQRVIGGGYSAQTADVVVTGSWPDGSYWRMQVRNNGASSSTFAVVAVCMATQIP